MPFPDPGFPSGSSRCDVSAGKIFFGPMSDLMCFFLSIPAVFVIEIDIILPGRLSLGSTCLYLQHGYIIILLW